VAPEPLLLRRAEVDGVTLDVRIADGRVVAMGDLAASAGDRVLDAAGGALLPGLHDHHIHLLALAASLRSIRLGPPDVHDPRQLAAALSDAAARLAPGQWLRGVGYHESVAGPLDRWALDALVGDRLVRVQDRSGALWTLSSAAVTATGLDVTKLDGIERTHDGEVTGRVWRLDEWLRARIPSEPLDLSAVGRGLAARGVTGVTDATPTTDAESLRLLAGHDLPQRIVVTGPASLSTDVVPELERGPVKVLSADHAPPDLDELLAAVRAARAAGRAVAIHCVSAVAAVVAVAAIEQVGPVPGDRIEHGAVVPLDLAHRIAQLGITVVTNPGFVAERGDRYAVEVDAADRPDLWRCRSLLGAGVRVGAGTDAPFGAADPWAAMAAAVDRRTVDGQVLGPHESLAPRRALQLFLAPLDRPGAPARAVEVGTPADLCLLATPLAHALADLRAVAVATTIIAGEVVHS
jgi:predicted amidohydrolase YtcJ